VSGVSIYGRQWFSPACSQAFEPLLIRADSFLLSGRASEALHLYKRLASDSFVARKRLAVAKRQSLTNGYYATSPNKLVGIHFCDWYPDFDCKNNFILHLFKYSGVSVYVCDYVEADLIIAGCYGQSLFSFISDSFDKLVLFVSGENLAPAYNVHDFSLTTWPNLFCGKNVRLPQWYCELLASNPTFFAHETPQLCPPFLSAPVERPFLFAAIYNNSTPLRDEVISVLSQRYGSSNVHLFGSQRSGFVNKSEILSRTHINICFENSVSPGYITEKLFHALAHHCYALYWGDPSFKDDFVDARTYNFYENPCFDKLLEWCDSVIKIRRSSPDDPTAPSASFFSSQPTLAPVCTHLRNICNSLVSLRFFGLGQTT